MSNYYDILWTDNGYRNVNSYIRGKSFAERGSVTFEENKIRNTKTLVYVVIRF